MSVGPVDLRNIDRSSFMISTRARAHSYEQEQTHNPFIRTQSLFKKNTSREHVNSKEFHPTTRTEESVSQFLEDAREVSKAKVPVTEESEQLNVRNEPEEKPASTINEVSFFDSFGKSQKENRPLRVHTELNEVTHRKNMASRSIYIMDEERESRDTAREVGKPVTQFYLNLNLSIDKPNNTTQKKNSSICKTPPTVHSKPQSIMKKLKDVLLGVHPKHYEQICRKISNNNLQSMAEVTGILQDYVEGTSEAKPVEKNKRVKERICMDNDKQVHIEMVKVEAAPTQQIRTKNSYQRLKQRVAKTSYGMKSRFK